VHKRRAAADGEADHDASHRLIVGVAHLDHGGDGGVLLDDVDGVLTLEDDDLPASVRRGILRRALPELECGPSGGEASA